MAAEELGMDGAWLRIHHFGRSLANPLPTLAAIGAKTTTLDLGTGVLDMRFENPAHLAEAAGITDLLSTRESDDGREGDGRLQLGIGRGTPLPAIDALDAFGQPLPPGVDPTADARTRTTQFLRAITGAPIAHSRSTTSAADIAIAPLSPGLPDRIWWGSASTSSSLWAAEQGMNILSSMIMLADDGRPFHIQQADQFRAYRQGHSDTHRETGGKVAVLRSVFPITSDDDRAYFGHEGGQGDGTGILDGKNARTGPTYAGTPEHLSQRLATDEAVQEADYVLFALPNQLGVDYNTHLLQNLHQLAHDASWQVPALAAAAAR